MVLFSRHLRRLRKLREGSLQQFICHASELVKRVAIGTSSKASYETRSFRGASRSRFMTFRLAAGTSRDNRRSNSRRKQLTKSCAREDSVPFQTVLISVSVASGKTTLVWELAK